MDLLYIVLKYMIIFSFKILLVFNKGLFEWFFFRVYVGF